jgi:multidrug efflux pump subunit AcrB
VLLEPTQLASRNLTPAGLIPMLQQANRQFHAGGLNVTNREVAIETGGFLRSAEEVGAVVVGVYAGRPVHLRDVATVVDDAEEPTQYVLYGNATGGPEEPAVTLSIAKRPGANAIDVAREVLRKVDSLRGHILPSDVTVSVTRHYGETAAEKSNELLQHMGIAVAGVSLLVLLILGWRESLVVALAIPATLALTLVVFHALGFTLNRITLFALIFSIGILVDDAIVVVENIVRHFRLPANRGRRAADIAVDAVREVGNPTVLATWAVIAAVLPMAFVGGLMGPYMRPIPVGAAAAMVFSLVIAFLVTPWAAIRLLPPHAIAPSAGADSGGVASDTAHPEDWSTRAYRAVMDPLLHHRGWRLGFLAGIVGLLLAAMALVPLGWVKVKMLPFDNKSEFQVILNMPEGTTLEHTARVAREIAAAMAPEPEITDYQIYAGTASPFNFNGLVRHYFLRGGASQADIQVNLLPRHHRKAQSHDIARRVRPRIAAIAARYGARVAVAEVPPGPPVLQTLVTEVYGPDETSRIALAHRIIELYRKTPGVVDVDWYLDEDSPKARFVVDKEKAALHGITAESLARTLRIAVGGESVDLVHMPHEKEDVNLVLEMARSSRATPQELLALKVRSEDANALPEPGGARILPPLVPLRELVTVESTTRDRSLYRKNLMPVTYVLGDVAGSVESPVYAILRMNRELAELDASGFGGSPGAIRVYNASMPFSDQEPSVKWDGEWHITLEVFRDLGTAFAAVLVLIYILMVGWFRSFQTPLLVMAAIPFSLVGILPAHGAMGAFFTATSMIGFMAGAGIVIRNSIILVDFIEQRIAEGMPLAEAVVDAGAVRFRPMLLTALAVVVGAAVILADPIFQGLAIALMAGEIASLSISRLAVPVLYFMFHRPNRPGPM